MTNNMTLTVARIAANPFSAALSMTRPMLAFMAASLLLQSASLASDKKKHDFEFANVADSTQGFTNFETFPAINNKGVVVFVAARSGVGQGVFTSRDGEVTTIASEMDGLRFFGNDPAINARGTVVFGASTSSGSRAIFASNGQSKWLIADSAANGLVRNGIGSPSINGSGTVAFMSVRSEPGFPSSIFTGTGGPLTKVLSTSSTGFGAFGNVAINDAGKIAFRGNLVEGTEGVFKGTDKPVDIVTTKTNPELGAGFTDPVMNNAGTIAVVGFRTAGGLEVITGNARGITLRNDPANPAFTNSEHPSINNHGAVAFFAVPFPDPAAPTGIFLEVSGGRSLIPVIRPGDTLFGSTVSTVDLGRFALNDRFELAFQYSLQDGRSGIAIASFHGEKESDDGQ